MVSSFVSAVTLMLAFIFGPPVGYARLHKRDGLSLGEGRFYCTYCAYRYIRTKLHPLKMGWVTASLLIGKLNAMPKHNTLVRSMQEYGRLIKTNFILRYLCNPEFRRQIHRQLNKGEALHALRRYLMVAQEAQIRKRYPDDQLNQAHCLNLVTNAVVVWNTIYTWQAIEQLKREGRQIDEEDVRHLSPARYEHINVYGRYFFPIGEEMNRKGLRPLRKPGDEDRFGPQK